MVGWSLGMMADPNHNKSMSVSLAQLFKIQPSTACVDVHLVHDRVSGSQYTRRQTTCEAKQETPVDIFITRSILQIETHSHAGPDGLAVHDQR